MSRWIEHVKAYAKKNNITYGCAMGDPQMKEEYYKKYPKGTKTEPKKEKTKPKKVETSKPPSEEELLVNTIVNFKNKFIKPYQEKPNKMTRSKLIKKYNKFSSRVKEEIKKRAPKMDKLIMKLIDEEKKKQRE